MDPITRTAQEFIKSWQRFRQSSKARLFKVDTDPSMHHDLCRIFRALEWSPGNRSPFFIFDAPFANRATFFGECTAKLAGDYALIREGLGKDGVQVNELRLPLVNRAQPEENFGSAVEAVWEQVKSQFEYLMLIFLPAKIDTGADWPISIEKLMNVLAASKVRIAAADTQDGLLKEVCDRLPKAAYSGTFFISNDAVQRYMFKVAAGGWKAVSGDGKKTATNIPDQKQVPVTNSQPDAPLISATTPGGATADGGQAVLAPDEAAALRLSMAKAAAASAEQRIDDAIGGLCEARMICRRNGLATHEAIVVMAIANTFLAGQNDSAALNHYAEAIAIAAQAQAHIVVLQARMGEAATWFRAQDYDRGAQIYEQASEDAVAAESEIMRIESLRMAGTCHNLRNRPDEAARCWHRALGVGSSISAPEVGASTLEQVGQAFVDLCRERGLSEQAESVQRQIEAIKERVAVGNSDRARAPDR